MIRSSYLALSALVSLSMAQSGIELDQPMLQGPPRTGPTAMLRFGCSQVVIERLDPYVPYHSQIFNFIANKARLVNPDQNPSAHMHQIVGGVRPIQPKPSPCSPTTN